MCHGCLLFPHLGCLGRGDNYSDSGGGYRHYPKETVNRIHFIKRSQELGFTLNEIEGLLALNDSPCSKVQELANKKLIAVQKKMADLLLLEHALEEHLGQCQNNDDDSHCPIIDSLQPK